MQIKRFVGISTSDALAQVKRELGPEAFILTQREFVPGNQSARIGTKPLVEITAAVDHDFDANLPRQKSNAAAPSNSTGTKPASAAQGQQGQHGQHRQQRLRNYTAGMPQEQPLPAAATGLPREFAGEAFPPVELAALRAEVSALKEQTAALHQNYLRQATPEIRERIVKIPLRFEWPDNSDATPQLAAAKPAAPAAAENRAAPGVLASVKNELPPEAQAILQRLEAQGLDRQLLAALQDELQCNAETIRGSQSPLLTQIQQYSQQTLSKQQAAASADFAALTRVWLARQYECATPAETVAEDGRPFICALVGPTGAGKTTTLAKLAARRVLNGSKVGLISLDTYRIAAVEQLRVYSKLLRVPLEVASNETEFRAALSRLRDKDAIFIDTSGHSQRRIKPLRKQLEILGNCNVHLSLVMSLTSKDSVLHDVFGSYQNSGVNDLIFTKLDEATEFASVMNIASRCQKPVAFLTTGQQVPEDIEIPNHNYISDLCMIELETVKI